MQRNSACFVVAGYRHQRSPRSESKNGRIESHYLWIYRDLTPGPVFQKLDQQPTNKKRLLECEWFSMKRFGNMLAPSSPSAVDLYCCRWLKMILWEWTSQLDLFQANFLPCTMYVNMLQEKNTWQAQQAIHHTPTIWSEWKSLKGSFFLNKQQQTCIRLISDPILKSVDSHSSHTHSRNFPPKFRKVSEWVSFPAQICRCRPLAKELNLGISF